LIADFCILISKNKNFLMLFTALIYVVALISVFTNSITLISGIITLFLIFSLCKNYFPLKYIIAWLLIFYLGIVNSSLRLKQTDDLLNLAYEVLSKNIDSENKVVAFREFSKAVGNMIKGEFVDVDCEGKNIDYDTLMYMHHNKTGALIKGSIRIGAILAGADELSLKRLERYADNIGITFQIKDDLLSLNGDFKKLGKPIGNDALNEKCTFVTLLGEEIANENLTSLTAEAVKIADEFGEKGEFLKELAIFIKDREY